MANIIPRSASQAKDLLLPGIYREYGSSDNFDVYVKNNRDVMVKDANGEHLLISASELKDGWQQTFYSRMAKIRGR